MSTDLVTNAEVVASWSGFSSLDSGEQAALISAASRAVEGYLGRVIGSGSYDEVACPDGRDGVLLLKHRPVTAVSRVSCGPMAVLSVSNTSSSNALATVEMVTSGDIANPTYTGLKCTHIASGTATVSSTLAFATYTTLSSLATAIEALAGSWDATVASGYDSFPSAQLWKQVGARDAKSEAAEFQAFTEDMNFIELDEASGKVTLPRWPRSDRRVRVQYSAGYATADVPADIKRATIAMVRHFRSSVGTGSGVVESSFGDRSYKLADPSASGVPAVVASLLGPYRDRRFL